MMKLLLSLCLIGRLLLFCCPVLCAPVNYTVFYVSTQGSDSNNGSITAPFATLQKAVSASANQNNAIIKLRGGTYQMTSTISLNSTHKGLSIEAYPGEQVTLTGANQIPFSAFTKVTDTAILNRIIEPAGKEKVMQVKLSDVGVTNLGQIQWNGFSGGPGFPPTLTWNDTLMQYARYPNEGYVYSKDVIRTGTSGASLGNLRQCEFTIQSDRWQQWSQAKDIWSLNFLCHDWADYSTPTTITANNTLTAYTSPSYPATSNRRIRFFNLLEELDMPGEFYVDRTSGYLYLIPPQEIMANDQLSYTSYSNQFFSITSTSNITLKGIRLEGTTGRGINVSNCSYVVIDNCEMTAIGDYAVTFKACSYSGVKHSYLHELNSGGVYFNNCGNRTTLTKSYCFLTNNKIKTFSQYRRTYAPGVYMSGTGITVSHNEFEDSPHFASRFETNESIFEYNDFTNICNDTSDAGVLYSGRNFTTRGNIIRYNYFRELSAITTTTGMKMNAVYLDDEHSSTAVYGNIFYKTSAVALYGGGRNNTFENNLLLDCSLPFRIDSRGLKNPPRPGSELYNSLVSMPYKTGIWAQTYPELVNILEDQPEYPKYNTIQNNVMYQTPAMRIDEPVIQYGTVKNNITITSTSSFVDYKNKNFNLKPGSEILTKLPDWKEIPIEKIGRYPREEDVSVKPDVTDVTITGNTWSGYPLTAEYTYQGYGFSEGNSSYTWYIRQDGEFKPIYNHNFKTYVPTAADRGKQIRVVVTPVNAEGVTGEPIRSAPVSVTRPPAAQLLTATLSGTTLSIQNNDSQSIPVIVAQPNYVINGQLKTMTNPNVQRKSILPFGSVTVTVPQGQQIMAFCADTLEPIRIKSSN